MQLSGDTISREAAIIIHSIGNIRVLLQFIEQNPAAYSMDCAGRYEDDIAGCDIFLLQQVLQRHIFNCFAYLCGRSGDFETVYDGCRSEEHTSELQSRFD